MPSAFNARNAAAYERLMGRWSRRLARPFLEHAGTAPDEHVRDVGCGTGSLTFALAETARSARFTATDFEGAAILLHGYSRVKRRGIP